MTVALVGNVVRQQIDISTLDQVVVTNLQLLHEWGGNYPAVAFGLATLEYSSLIDA